MRRISRLGLLSAALFAAAGALLLAVAPSGCNKGGNKPRIAYVTNGVDPFWDIAAKGARDAEKEFNVDLQVIMPKDAGDQKQKIEDLLVRGIDGIAISPIDAPNQTPSINDWAAKTRIITQDSDAPESKRLMYIGVDNYAAGRLCGQLVKEAVPQGGKVAIFVGRLGQDNARLRRQGLIDELLDRPADQRGNDDAAASNLKGPKYTVVATRTDDFDRARAKSNVEDVLTSTPDLAAVAGLFAYNPPACLEGLRSAGKLGKVACVGFDEQEATRQAIKDGTCFGTVVQNPYMYGHESVRVLAKLVKGDQSVIPANKYLDIPPRKITKTNIAEFEAELKKNLGQ
jgi:ribose transport system substrate-binding protein